MGLTPTTTALASLASAFAAACRLSRTDGELLERCRVALVQRFQSERIWFTLVAPEGDTARVGPAGGFEEGAGSGRRKGGGAAAGGVAGASVAFDMRAVALPLVLGLSVVFELRGILLDR